MSAQMDNEPVEHNAPATPSSDTPPPQQRPPFPIVGIGSSAGGLEALEKFFTHMPRDSGIAFVLCQHLGAGQQDMLGTLMERFTAMQVRVLPADDGTPIEPNRVYILPSDRDAALHHQCIELTEPAPVAGVRLPIDIFFRSLAENLREHAICIILSGGGSDGSKGMTLIKEQGGMAMVQSPTSASQQGMPQSAINTDLVDYILRPEEMPAQLLEYVKKEFLTGERPVESRIPTATNALQRIFAVLQRQTGHDFSRYKQNTITRRVARRMIVNQIEQIDDYARYIENRPLETDALFRELLIGVTGFFRDPDAFAVLEQEVIPHLFADRARDDTIRVWVPACSTGEEAYSIAILLSEYMRTYAKEYEIQIFATDIDPQAIERARQGVYPENIAAELSAERLQRFFINEDGTYQISKRLRDMVVFALQSIIKDPPFSRLDLISCRNLLIYLGSDLQKQVIPLFYYGLKPEGFLFLGTSESLGEEASQFHAIDRKAALYQRPRSTTSLFRHLEFPPPPAPHVLRARTQKNREAASTIRTLIEQALVERYAPACAVVSEHGDLLYTLGRTGLYLEPPQGEMNSNIVSMAREGLRLPLTTALRKVNKQHQEVVYKSVQVQTNGDTRLINLVVSPLPERSLLLVIFEETPHSPARITTADDEGERTDGRDALIQQLEQELQATREYLQVTTEELETSNEELKSTNEELQSANEELQSTNEELETSKEELQSMHEEQVTVNSELRNKMDQVNRANSDLQNLLASIEVGTIFLDMELCIQRFTPMATRVISLRDADIGRPLSELVAHIANGYDLTSHAQHVLDTLDSYSSELQTHEGEWYWMRILPYRTSDNVIAGVTMTFTNITQHKHEREQLPRLLQMAEKSASMIMMTDTSGTVEYVNPHLLTVTGYTEKEILGQTPRLFKASQQALEQYEQAWQQVLAGQEWEGEFQHRHKDGTTYWVNASFSPVRNASGAITNVVIAEEDISFRKHAATQRQRMNRLLATLGTWHRQSATTADTQAIPAAMCRLLVEVGGYRGAWVALLVAGAPGRVVPTVQAGFKAGYLEHLDPLWCAHTQAQSPLHAPLHTGAPAIIAPLHDADVPPVLGADAQRHHYQQVVALAIRTETSTCGVLVVAASDSQALQAVEVETLQILADNLAYYLCTAAPAGEVVETG